MMQTLTVSPAAPAAPDYIKIYKVGMAVGASCAISMSAIHRNPRKDDVAIIGIQILKGVLKSNISNRIEYIFRFGTIHGIISATILVIDQLEGPPLNPLLSDMLIKCMLGNLLLMKASLPER